MMNTAESKLKEGLIEWIEGTFKHLSLTKNDYFKKFLECTKEKTFVVYPLFAGDFIGRTLYRFSCRLIIEAKHDSSFQYKSAKNLDFTFRLAEYIQPIDGNKVCKNIRIEFSKDELTKIANTPVNLNKDI